MYALVVLLLVILIGAGGGYWAVKKIRAKQNQEFLYEGKMTLIKEGIDAAELKNAFLVDSVLDGMIQELDLVTRWELPDAEAAKAQIRQKFKVKINGLEVTFRYKDKDKNLAQQILKRLVEGFNKRQFKATEGAF